MGDQADRRITSLDCNTDMEDQELTTADLPVSQMAGTVQSRTTNRVVLQNAFAVQEVFNQANITNTDIRLNIEVHDNKAPILFGSNNAIINQGAFSDRQDEVSKESKQDEIVSSIARNLIDLTEASIKSQIKRCFVETKGVQAVISTLEQFGVAIISGKVGDGKTTVALEVMNRIRDTQNKVPIQIQSGSMWQSAININGSFIVFIDDIFGQDCFSKDLFQKWRPYFHSIRTCIQNGDILVLITCRKDILTEAIRHMKASKDVEKAIFAESNIIDFTDKYKLSTDEKREMIEKYVTSHPERTISNKFVDENLSVAKARETIVISRKTINLIIQRETVLGFPLMCSLFINDKSCLRSGLQFFQKLSPILLKEIEALYYNDRIKYFTLVYMFMNNKIMHLNVKQLFRMSAKERELFLEIADKCGVTLTSGLSSAVKESAEILSDVFIKFHKQYNAYEFIDDSVLDAICVIFGEDFPQDVLKKCTDAFICDFVCTEKSREFVTQDARLTISSDNYYLLAEIITRILLKDLRLFESLMPLKDENFVDDLFTYLADSENLNLLLSTICKTGLFDGHSVLYFSADNSYFLSKVFDNGVLELHERKWIQTEMHLALDCALRKGNRKSVVIFVNHGASLTDDSLSIAVESGSQALVNDILSSGEFSVKAKHKALCLCCGRGDITMVRYLIEDHNVLTSVRCLIGTVLSDSVQLVQYLLNHKQWDMESKTEALDVACRRGNTAIIQLLEKQGALYSQNGLTSAVESGNNCTLVYILCNHSWTNEQKTKALDFVCSKGRLDMIKSLQEHDALFSSDSLLKAVLSKNEAVLKHVLVSYSWSDSQVKAVYDHATERGDNKIVQCLKQLTISTVEES